jgi:hypothetical protein
VTTTEKLTFASILNANSDDLIPESAFDNAEDGIPCKRTMQRYNAQRIGPPKIRIGNRNFYRRSSFREWLLSLEQRQVKAGGAK